MHSSKLLVGLGFGLLAHIVGAQQPMLEEVVVTAQKRAQSLQDVPISVGAVMGEAIQAQGMRELEDLSAQMPNVVISESAIGDKLFIRGIGSGINAGFEQSVGTFIDGVYHGRSLQSRSQFLDVERVEVLRGPQSTFFGNNTIAGALNIVTAKPTQEREGYVRALGNLDHGEYQVEAVASGGVTETLALRGAISFTGMDGWLDNSQFDDEPQEENMAGRVTAAWTPNDEFDATFKVEVGSFMVEGRTLQNINCPASDAPPAGACQLSLAFFPGFDDTFDENKTVGGAVPDAYTGAVALFGAGEAGLPVPTPDPAFFRQDLAEINTRNYTLTWNYDLNEHTITSVTGHSAYGFDFIQDSDFSPIPLISSGQNENFEQWSQELRITSPSGGLIDWMAGFYWQTSELMLGERINIYGPPPFFAPQASFNPLAGGDLNAAAPGFPRQPATIGNALSVHDQDEETFAGFFSATWNVTDYLRLTFGARYTDVSKDLVRTQVLTDGAPGVSAGCPAPFALAGVCIAGTPFLFSGPNPPTFGWGQGTLIDSRNDNDFTPSVNVQWDVNDQIMVYASYAEGFKAGGFDQRNLFLNPDTGTFAPESVDAYEVGAKTAWFDNTLQVNLSWFRSEYANLQVSTFDGVINFLVNNAAASTTTGIEVDGRWAATENLSFSFAFAYLDAEWDSFENAQCTAGQFRAALTGDFSQCAPTATGFAQDLSGAPLLMSPEFSGNLFAEYVWPLPRNLEVVTQVSVMFEDDQFLAADNDPNTMQESYAKVDLRIALGSQDGKWDIAFVGKNLTDELTAHHSEDQPLSSGSFFRLTDRPVSLSVQGTYRW